MPYAPTNVLIYTVAFNSCLSGIAASLRVASDVISTDYVNPASIAGQWAQALDTAWASAAAPDTSQVLGVWMGTYGLWEGRGPVAGKSTDWNALAGAVVAQIQAGEAFFASQSITSPPWGGTPFTLPSPTGPFQVLTSTGAGAGDYTWLSSPLPGRTISAAGPTPATYSSPWMRIDCRALNPVITLPTAASIPLDGVPLFFTIAKATGDGSGATGNVVVETTDATPIYNPQTGANVTSFSLVPASPGFTLQGAVFSFAWDSDSIEWQPYGGF